MIAEAFRILGLLGLAGFVWLTVFQLMLTAGLPLGHMAWGGAQRVLSPQRRWASLGSAGLAIFCIGLMLQAMGLWSFLPDWLLRPALWAIAALFAVSLLGNAMSESRIERLHGVPLTVLLSLSSAVAALA